MRENSRCSRAVEACTCYHAWLRFRQIPIPIASRPHRKHLPEMIPGFGAGLVIETRSLPNLLVATLAPLPSMSLIPSAPFPSCGNRRQSARCNREKILLRRSSLRSRFGGVGGYGGTSVVVQAPTALKSAVTQRCYSGFASRRRASKSRGRVSIAIEPSGLCGHSSFGRSR